IQSEKTYEPVTSLYEKRHIAFDIPSLYGYYKEVKFDAAALFLKILFYLKAILSDLVSDFVIKYPTKDNLLRLLLIMRLCVEALALEGTQVRSMKAMVEELEESIQKANLTLKQILDIIEQIHQELRNTLVFHHQLPFLETLKGILQGAAVEDVLPKYLSKDPSGQNILKDRLLMEEIFFRDMVGQSVSLQELDELLNKAYRNLHRLSSDFRPEHLQVLITSRRNEFIIPITQTGRHPPLPAEIGAKAYFLWELLRMGYPVPRAFVFTRRAFLLKEILLDKRLFLEELLRARISFLEKVTQKTFGKGKRPLILSVRSGARISMPGMMHSVLNVGIPKELLEAESTFYRDCYIGFLETYALSWGIEKDAIKLIKEQVSAAHLIDELWELIKREGLPLPSNPYEALRFSILGVMGSWNSRKAKTYREVMDISHEWGTGVIVQEMVFGNLNKDSGSGVVFSHDKTGLFRPNGDVVYGLQGEEVVSGRALTFPISIEESRRSGRPEEESLEYRFPQIYNRLHQILKELTEIHQFGPVELEFTFEGRAYQDLFILQMRQMPIIEEREGDKDLTIDPGFKKVAKGIGVFGGILKGRIVFHMEEIKAWRKREPNTKLILVREDTSPEDIMELYNSDGLLTSKGGA
ncbi:MAG: PEP/pyruvate-binding domain-containing protein, partial [Desulfatiglandales bacterium]